VLLEDPASGGPDLAATVLTGAVLAGVGLAVAPMVVDLGRRWIPERNQFFARWGFTHLAVLLLVFLVAFLVVPSLWIQLRGAELDLLESLLVMGLVLSAPACYVLHCARRLDPDGLRCLGFRAPGSLRAFCFGLASYALLLPALLGVMILWPFLLEFLGGEARPQDSVVAFLESSDGTPWAALLLAVVVLPFFEELLFRSFLQPLLVQNFREVGGVAVTSLVFASLHGAGAFLPVFVLSLIMGGVMLRTQRFVACWAVHALHNGLVIWALLQLPAARELVEIQEALLPLTFLP